MSQYTFNTDTHQLAAGWDRPMNHFFLMVFDLKDLDGDPVFTNLDLPNMSMSIEQIQAKCLEYGVALPAPVLHEMLKDCEEDRNPGLRKFDMKTMRWR